MQLTIDTTIQAWDYRKESGKLPKGIEEALKHFTIIDFIELFTNGLVSIGDYAFAPSGMDESDELEDIYLFKVYKDDDDLFDWISGEKDEPRYFELAISFN